MESIIVSSLLGWTISYVPKYQILFSQWVLTLVTVNRVLFGMFKFSLIFAITGRRESRLSLNFWHIYDKKVLSGSRLQVPIDILANKSKGPPLAENLLLWKISNKKFWELIFNIHASLFIIFRDYWKTYSLQIMHNYPNLVLFFLLK